MPVMGWLELANNAFMYDVKLSRQLKLINSSRADSHVNDIIALMMGTETVPETLDFNELTRLSA
jgi:hypothetical protein